MSEFRETIRLLRKRKNLTQEELAELIGTKRQTVSSWEQGRTEPNASVIPSLCIALDVSPSSLLGFEEAEKSGTAAEDYQAVMEKLAELNDWQKERNEEKTKLRQTLISLIIMSVCLYLIEFSAPLALFNVWYLIKTKQSIYMKIAAVYILFELLMILGYMFFPMYMPHIKQSRYIG